MSEGEARHEAAERIARSFGEALGRRAPIGRDRGLAGELEHDARPVIEALLYGLQHADPVSRDSAVLREAFALASLFGRRIAHLGTSPTGLLSVLPSLSEALRDDRSQDILHELEAVMLEGYVAARDESAEQRSAKRAADAIAVVELAPRCIVVIAAGDQASGEIERVVDELGRRLLKSDAQGCLIHMADLEEPDRERARQIFSAHLAAAMLGVHCVFSGVLPAWRDAATEAGMDLSDVRFADSFATGLSEVLAAAGLLMDSKGGNLAQLFRRLVGGRNSR